MDPKHNPINRVEFTLTEPYSGFNYKLDELIVTQTNVAKIQLTLLRITLVLMIINLVLMGIFCILTILIPILGLGFAASLFNWIAQLFQTNGIGTWNYP